MNNSYIIAIVIVLVAVLGFMLRSKKSEAPLQQINGNTNAQNLNVSFVDGSYKLDTSSSTIFWRGEYLTGLSEKGTVLLKSGDFKVANGIIVSGQFEIDMNTIESIPHKERLVNHLKAEDFFDTTIYPTSTFILKKMIPASEEGAKAGRYVIAGDLVVRGISKPISFTATLNGGEKTLSATADFAINRADWEIKYNSPTFFKNLGDKIIRDAVEMGLDLKAQMVIE